MTARVFAALIGAAALHLSWPSFAENHNGNGQGGGSSGGSFGTVVAPEFDGQTAALGIALATGAVAALKARFRRR